MNFKISALFGIIILLFLFSSCSSIPLPGTPTESLFILSGDLEHDLGTNSNGHGHTLQSVRLKVVNQETEKVTDLLFYPNKNFVAVTLEPGKYEFESRVVVTVRYKGGRDSNPRNEYIARSPFLVEESTVFISPVVLSVVPRNGWYGFSSYSSTSMKNIRKKDTVEAVFDERRYKAWELYQLIGWELEEE